MTRWYYKDAGHEMGPVDGAFLKQLADCGRLSPGDAVRREDMPNWVPANRITGLFARVTAPTAAPAAAPAAAPPVDKRTEPEAAFADIAAAQLAAPRESATGGGSGLLSTLKTATALAARHAQLKTLEWELQRADEITGAKALAALIGKQRCADLYDRISAVDEELALKRRADPVPGAESTADKAKRVAYEATKKVAIESLLSQRTKYVRELGERLRATADSAETAALADELKQSRRADVKGEAMKAELAALSRQTPQLVKRLALVAASTVLLVAGYWAYGFVAGLRHSAALSAIEGGGQAEANRIKGQLAELEQKRELEAAQRTAREKVAAEKNALSRAEFARQREGDRAELEARQQQAAAKNQLEMERQQFEAEKKAKEAELARQKMLSVRRSESAASEAAGNVERQRLADELFGKIELDPARGVLLSKTLKQRFKASVELRGPSYKSIAELHAKRNWTGLINLVSSSSFLDLPDATTIERTVQDLSKYDFTILLRTSVVPPTRSVKVPVLHLISFPWQIRGRYSHAVQASEKWQRHPDGIGFFHPWHVSDGYSIVVLAMPDAVRRSVMQVNAEVNEKMTSLDTKLKLGEIDETTVQMEADHMLTRVCEQVSAWAAAE